MKKALAVANLSINYGSRHILHEVTCHVPHSVVAAIVGPNGAGKSTFVKAILGLIQSQADTISFFGLSLDQVRNRIAYIPQRADIDWDFPVTVYDVALMGRYPFVPWFSSLSLSDHKITRESIDLVGLTRYRDVPISKLSGGQQQLCFIARALAMQADLYILDEPFIGVDEPTEKKIISLLHQLRNEGKTIIIVHHDLYTLSTYFDWMICLNHSVVAQGDVKEITSDQEWIAKVYKRFLK